MNTYFDIHLHVDDEGSLYNPFDPTGKTINGDVYSYIAECYSEKHLREVPRLVVSSDSPIDQERLEAAFLHSHRAKLEHNQRESKRNTARMTRLLTIGLVFIVIGIASSNLLNAVWAEVLSIIGSFSVWEAAGCWLEVRPELRLKNKLLKQLERSEIIINP